MDTDTMHLVHWNCPMIQDREAEVRALCGASTKWANESALKCPVCLDLHAPAHCPMCGMTIGVMEP